MRSVSDTISVRLYHLDGEMEGGAATTLFYGSLAEALAIAARQPTEMQDGLFIATDNDVIAYLDLIEDCLIVFRKSGDPVFNLKRHQTDHPASSTTSTKASP